MPHTLSIVRHNRRPLGFIGLLVLASCLHGAVKPAATLAPRSADALPRSAGRARTRIRATVSCSRTRACRPSFRSVRRSS